MARPTVVPMCACSHVHGLHPGGGACRVYLDHHHDDNDQGHENCTRCPCGKFRVPSAPGKPKTKKTTRTTTRSRRGTPWWR